MPADKFSFDLRIYYQDTDCEGVVYYANYLTYCERARMEFFLARGISLGAYKEQGYLFVVSRAEVFYRAPAHLGDHLRVSVDCASLGASRIDFVHTVIRMKDRALIAEVKTRVACVGEDFKPVLMPASLKEKLLSSSEE